MIYFFRRIHFRNYFSKSRTHEYSISSIRILSRLHNPYIFGNYNPKMLFYIWYLGKVVFFIFFSYWAISIRFGTITFCLSFFFDKLSFLGIKLSLFMLLFFFKRNKNLFKLNKFMILEPIFNVKSQRKNWKRILTLLLIILSHVEE